MASTACARASYPEDVDSARKELDPTYNRAGALQAITFDGTDYVRHIAYNAKGQRVLLAWACLPDR
jgi:hypothetical protein